MPQIIFEDISHSYDGKEVLHNINLSLTEHRVGITGFNGSGKSTLVRMINGLVTPSHGKVLIDGTHVAKNSKKVRQHVGFVFAHPTNQIIMPTVIEDVEFSLRKRIKDKKARKNKALEYLSTYGLAPYADQSPYCLSGGQQQLLAVTAVMATEPKIIIADEPTGLLDLRNAFKLRQLFSSLTAQMVVVSHDFNLLQDMDRVIVLNNGTIVADDKPDTALDFYKELAMQ